MRVCFRWRSVRFACFVVCGGLFFFVLFGAMYRERLISIYWGGDMYIERGFCVCIGNYFILSKNVGWWGVVYIVLLVSTKSFWNSLEQDLKKMGLLCSYGCLCIGDNIILSENVVWRRGMF